MDGKVHTRVSGNSDVITTDLISGLKPGDKVHEEKISPATREALKGVTVDINLTQTATPASAASVKPA